MFNLPTNINKRERIVRGALGGLLIVGAILGLGHVFAVIIGLILIAEASISYCGLIALIEKFKLDADKPSDSSKPQV